MLDSSAVRRRQSNHSSLTTPRLFISSPGQTRFRIVVALLTLKRV